MELAAKQHTTTSLTKKQGNFFGKKSEPSFFAPALIQPKLTIGPVDDPYEREADAIADKVMRMSDTQTLQAKPSPINIQRKCAACDEEEEQIQRKCSHCDEEEEKVQMKTENGDGGGMTAPPLVHDVINSRGQPLDTGTRGFMESRFGYDFGNVQVHNDSIAHQSSADINALAYTHGNHVVFGAGQYKPNSDSGRQVLAHELVHVIQQQHLNADIAQKYTTEDCEEKDIRAYITMGDYTARLMVKKALRVLKKSASNVAVGNLLLYYFKSKQPYLPTIIANFQEMVDEFNNDKFQYECEYDCQNDFEFSKEGYVKGLFSDIHLCINTIAGWDTNSVARLIIHEMGHYGAGLKEIKYCHGGDMCNICGSDLSEYDALFNSDSYACFAYNLWFLP